MLRGVATLLVVAILAVAGSASMPHVHDYRGHDHATHHHGPAAHAHEAAAYHQDQPESPAQPRVESCEPGDHAVAVAFTCVPATSHQPVLVAAVVTVLVTLPADAAGCVTPSDVRAHSPPRLTDAPLRAPPVVHPA